MKLEDIYLEEMLGASTGTTTDKAQAFANLEKAVLALKGGKGGQKVVDDAYGKLKAVAGEKRAKASMQTIENAWAEKTKAKK